MDLHFQHSHPPGNYIEMVWFYHELTTEKNMVSLPYSLHIEIKIAAQ